MTVRAGQGRGFFCVSLLRTGFLALAGLIALAMPTLAAVLPHATHRTARRVAVHPAPARKLRRVANIVRHPIRHIHLRNTPVRHIVVRHVPLRHPVVRRVAARRRVLAHAPARGRMKSILFPDAGWMTLNWNAVRMASRTADSLR